MVEVSKFCSAAQHLEIFSWRAYGTGSMSALRSLRNVPTKLIARPRLSTFQRIEAFLPIQLVLVDGTWNILVKLKMTRLPQCPL